MKYSFRSLILLLSLSFFSSVVQAQTTTSYNQAAKASYDKQDYDGVINNATLSLNVNANGEAYWWRALGYKNKKNYQIAISDFTKAIGYYTNDKTNLGNLYALRAESKMLMKNYDGAATDYEYILSNTTYTDKKKINKDLAVCLYELGEYEDAALAYSEAIKLTTSSVELSELYRWRAEMKLKFYSLDLKDVINDFTTAIQKNSQNASAYSGRGLAKYYNKEYEASLTDFSESIRLFEKTTLSASDIKILSSTYTFSASLKNFLGKKEEAKKDMASALKIDPQNGFVLWDMANMISRENTNPDEATDYYKKAIASLEYSKDKEACFIDLYLHERTRLNYVAAIQAIDAAIRLNSSDANHYWDKAYLLKQKKDYANAILNYDKAISLGIKDSTNRARIYLERGQTKQKMNDNNGALFDFQKSIELKPSYDNYSALGRFFKMKMKQNELGDGNLLKAMELSFLPNKPKDTTTNYVYAAAAMGDKRTVDRLMQKMLVNASAKIGQLANEYHNAACVYTTLGNYVRALEYLEQSLLAGYTDYDHMLSDTDLEPLFSMPEYKNLLVKYKVPQPIY